jgi:hypothetical protein
MGVQLRSAPSGGCNAAGTAGPAISHRGNIFLRPRSERAAKEWVQSARDAHSQSKNTELMMKPHRTALSVLAAAALTAGSAFAQTVVSETTTEESVTRAPATETPMIRSY